MKRVVLAILSCCMVCLFSGCGPEPPGCTLSGVYDTREELLRMAAEQYTAERLLVPVESVVKKAFGAEWLSGALPDDGETYCTFRRGDGILEFRFTASAAQREALPDEVDGEPLAEFPDHPGYRYRTVPLYGSEEAPAWQITWLLEGNLVSVQLPSEEYLPAFWEYADSFFEWVDVPKRNGSESGEEACVLREPEVYGSLEEMARAMSGSPFLAPDPDAVRAAFDAAWLSGAQTQDGKRLFYRFGKEGEEPCVQFLIDRFPSQTAVLPDTAEGMKLEEFSGHPGFRGSRAETGWEEGKNVSVVYWLREGCLVRADVEEKLLEAFWEHADGLLQWVDVGNGTE